MQSEPPALAGGSATSTDIQAYPPANAGGSDPIAKYSLTAFEPSRYDDFGLRSKAFVPDQFSPVLALYLSSFL